MEWKRIHHSKYLVSDTGLIYSEYENILLKPFKNNQGYLQVDLFDSGTKQRLQVNRIVANAFIPNPENKPIVNHINGIKTDNEVSNLEWCTYSENTIHSYETGLQARGEDKTLAKLTEKDVLEIQSLFESKEMLDRDIAVKYGVTSGVISAIRLGKTWTHVSGKVFEPVPKERANKKLVPEDIANIRTLFKEGKNDADIGRIYNVARGTINQIRQGHTWKNY